MKNNVGTIIRKEFARFFGDRTLLFTSVIMPGLLIYVIYTLMGSFMGNKIQEEIAKDQQQKTEFVSPLTSDEERLLDSLNQVRSTAYQDYESQLGESDTDELGDILGNLIPMLIIMLLFSGSMAVAPTAIAGEKERGTIATLLVTPMRRSELALGKIISLSVFALLSGISSFLGIILSLPKMLQIDGESADQLQSSLPNSLYSTTDYLLILLLIICTVLIIISAISIFSAWAKDVKSAGTMITPLMLFVMFAGLTPMISSPSSPLLYLIPVYNSAQCMASVFSFHVQILPLLITIASNLVYTGLAVFALTKMFNSEKVMFSK